MAYQQEDEKTLRARIGDEAYEVTQNAATESHLPKGMIAVITD